MEQDIIEEKEGGSSFDIGGFLLKLVKNYRWFVLSVALFLGGAYVYLRYSLALYQVVTYMMIKQPNDAANMLGGSPFSSGTGAASASNTAFTDVNNEIFKLQSADLVGEVVDSLRLDIAVISTGRVKNKQIDIDSLPFEITVKKTFADRPSPLYNLSLFNDHYSVSVAKMEMQGKYNEPLIVEGDTISIVPRESFATSSKNQYGLKLLGRSATIATCLGRLAVTALPKSGPGIIQVAVKDEIPQRAKKIIDVLINRYDAANREFKNKAMEVEMDFLNKRLEAVDSELETQENQVKDFRVNNQMYDVPSSAGQLLSTLPGLDTKKNENDLKKELLNLVEANITNYNGKEQVLTNTSGVQDAALSDMINKYNQLVLQKQTILQKGTAQDPRLPSLNGQLENSRTNILKNIEYIRNEIRTNESSLSTQEKNITSKYRNIPGKDKQLIEINRLLGIKQSLYVFLLQRREDKNIQLASAGITESRVIDTKMNKNVTEPKPLLIYSIALGAGFLLPALVILIVALANKKIESRKEVERATSLPIAGEIAFAGKNVENIVITSGSRTLIAEQFRSLRNNISYFGRDSSQKVILLSSSTSNEGKSFVSLNLANSIAISGKKVLLLDFDLRNPGLSVKLDAEESAGLTNFLIGEAALDEIIQPIAGCDNLFFISAGFPLPPNPGEMILSTRIEELFTYLRQNFDMAVVDTPPAGLVSDALSISRWADISFFILRHKYTLRSSIKLINELSKDQKLPNPALILNAVQDNKAKAYGKVYAYEQRAKNKRKKKTKNPVSQGEAA